MKWRLCKEGRDTFYIIPPENIIKKCGLNFEFKVFGEPWREYLKNRNVIFYSERSYTIKGEETAREILSKINSLWKKKLLAKMEAKK